MKVLFFLFFYVNSFNLYANDFVGAYDLNVKFDNANTVFHDVLKIHKARVHEYHYQSDGSFIGNFELFGTFDVQGAAQPQAPIFNALFCQLQRRPCPFFFTDNFFRFSIELDEGDGRQIYHFTSHQFSSLHPFEGDIVHHRKVIGHFTAQKRQP